MSLMHGAFPDDHMATCKQCGHEFIVIEPEVRDMLEQATPEFCAEWHDLAAL